MPALSPALSISERAKRKRDDSRATKPARPRREQRDKLTALHIEHQLPTAARTARSAPYSACETRERAEVSRPVDRTRLAWCQIRCTRQRALFRARRRAHVQRAR